jgi:hypothetical protein
MAFRNIAESSKGHRRPLPTVASRGRTPLKPLPSVVPFLTVIGVEFAVMIFMAYGVFTGHALALIFLVFSGCALLYGRSLYCDAINKREAVREENFWTAIDNVIGWYLPERSPELAKQEDAIWGPRAQLEQLVEKSRVHEASAVMHKYEGKPGSWRHDTSDFKLSKAAKRKARRKANAERYQRVLAEYRGHHHCEQEPCRHKPSSDYLAVKMRSNAVVIEPQNDEDRRIVERQKQAEYDAVRAIADAEARIIGGFAVPEQQMGCPPPPEVLPKGFF